MDSCKNFTILEDAIRLCIFYDLKKPIERIVQRFEAAPVTKSNLLDVLGVCEKLHTIEGFQQLFKDLTQELLGKCVDLCRKDLELYNLVKGIEQKNSFASKLCETIKNDSGSVTIR